MIIFKFQFEPIFCGFVSVDVCWKSFQFVNLTQRCEPYDYENTNETNYTFKVYGELAEKNSIYKVKTDKTSNKHFNKEFKKNKRCEVWK